MQPDLSGNDEHGTNDVQVEDRTTFALLLQFTLSCKTMFQNVLNCFVRRKISKYDIYALIT